METDFLRFAEYWTLRDFDLDKMGRKSPWKMLAGLIVRSDDATRFLSLEVHQLGRSHAWIQRVAKEAAESNDPGLKSQVCGVLDRMHDAAVEKSNWLDHWIRELKKRHNYAKRHRQWITALLFGAYLRRAILLHDAFIREQVFHAYLIAKVEPPQETYSSVGDLMASMPRTHGV